MQCRDMMIADPACCTPETSLYEVAQMMVENDCGCIPVVENEETMEPVGVVTDRDICCCTVAEGKNPLEMAARDCMTSPAVTVTPDTSLEDCCQVMQDKMIRRVVVDEQGSCCGIVAQADIALKGSEEAVAEVVQEVSEPTEAPSRVAEQ